MATRIFVAEDHRIMAEGLGSLLAGREDTEIVGYAEDGRTAVEEVGRLKPDLVLMDVTLPALNGIEATRLICRDMNNVRVIALSMHSEERMVMEMLKAGAKGYLLKESAFEELLEAVDAVMSGESYLSSAVSDSLNHHKVRKEADDNVNIFSILTKRERQVLQLLTEGKTTKQAALELKISPKTVETHRSNIMDKLELDNLADLTKYAVREGLTSLNL